MKKVGKCVSLSNILKKNEDYGENDLFENGDIIHQLDLLEDIDMPRGLWITGNFNELKEKNFSSQDQYDPFNWV